MLPRKCGFRIWLEGSYDEAWVPVLKRQMVTLGSEHFRMRVLTNNEVADLRNQDQKVKAHIQSVDREIFTAGLRVADNLSALFANMHKSSQLVHAT